jgi:valyl-tRNA synthetase
MNQIDLDKAYDPHAIEQDLYEQWEASGVFSPLGNGHPYCIVIPPPNVTGSLHMGHAFQDTIMDALIRCHRMRGENTLWQPGTDHAGIATQMVVERQLESEGRKRHDFTREEFIQRIWKWKDESGGTIARQLRRMGASLDWERERFTMDQDLSEAVRGVFVRLYREDLIYRGKRLVNWDPVLHTALSDLEVISEEEAGHLWHLRYPLVDGSGFLIVATTRPETMLGDAAVAVHPDDLRYRDQIGKEVRLPLTNRTIPVIADHYVDPQFGSGCLKITPAHDFNDYEVGQRHDLPLINILSPNAAIELPASPYHGLDRYAARQRIVADLEDAQLIEKIQDHRLTVPRGDRSQSVVEPYLTDQWFVRMAPLAGPAIDAVESGVIRFVPDHWSRTYFEWMRNIEDWCISRQIWWGHRIPAWYDEDHNIFVDQDEAGAQAQAQQKHGHPVRLHQDEDVLDTWFSSALWPFSTLGWPDQTPEFKTFYPTSVLVTGFDIIFFWVARMIAFGLKFADAPPFRDVYVHGLVRDANGQKMSKSKGNVLDPLDLIDGIDLDSLVKKRTTGLMQPQMVKQIERDTHRQFPNGISSYGTDALRFTFASLATQGRDIRFDLGRIEGYRNFCNKLWNATRFVLINTDGVSLSTTDQWETGTADDWITSRFQLVAMEVNQSFDGYRFDQVAQTLYGFIWDEFCSWYLEIAKIELASTSVSIPQRLGIRLTLLTILDGLLRLLHPLMPFITEALWQEISPRTGQPKVSIMTQLYPSGDPEKVNQTALSEITWIQNVVSGLRNIRGEMNIDPNHRIPVLVQGGDVMAQACLKRFRHLLIELARLESLKEITADTQPPESATVLVGPMKILVPLGSIIDRGTELKRLEREIKKLRNDLERSETKLKNKNFISKAPPDIVEKEQGRVETIRRSISELEKQRQRVERI